jgi:tRNA (uracil-5-)-methyltransferase TRM9
VDDETVHTLLALNRQFYDRLAAPFSQSRHQPQPGFARLLPHLPDPYHAVLDVGCGEGRFGRFLAAHGFTGRYVGVDFSATLLAAAAASMPGAIETEFIARDLATPGAIDGIGTFSLVVSLAVLQHIPGRANRARLLGEMAAHLDPGGRIFLSTWQFLDSERQRRKLVPWSAAGLDEAALEPADHLLTWRSGGYGLRYVAYLDATAIASLAADHNLELIAQFRSDGREGDLNLYTVLAVPS